ncbi:hypothetical protein [Pseudomonas sp. RIT-PI-AD]|uniref:hypothetical protein n=1 Tax=Pseudomonas sp. RIT-PI-AD TaxID=3035294 RepID=UPI0021DB31C2|nr:hypothetical protein [Pseudomonas sp. RIT-PI-AD]
MKPRLKRSEKLRWVVFLICWAGIGFTIYERNPLYFFASVIPYMLLGWFSDKIDGES